MEWVVFVLAAGAAAAAVQAARAVGVRRALLDCPNERSSHTIPVPRLGGAALVPVLVCAVLAQWRFEAPGSARIVFVAGVAVLFAIGLIDDVRSVSRLVRFALQSAVAAAMVAKRLSSPGE